MNARKVGPKAGDVALDIKIVRGGRGNDARAAVAWILRAATAVAAAVSVTGTAWAAGGPPATKLINVADTRNLEPGPALWIAQIYNDNYLLFGLLVVVVMVLQGLVFGFGFDRVMHWIGIDLGKLSHDE